MFQRLYKYCYSQDDYFPTEYRYNENVSSSIAYVRGSSLYPDIKGVVTFIKVPGGTEVSVEVKGLPLYQPAKDGGSPIGPFGFHIHTSGNCAEGSPENPFPGSGSHLNLTNQPHGNQTGDFPVLFSNNGYSRMTFFTDKFNVRDVIGKSIIIHENPDDYRTQPAGNSGQKIACGVIKELQYH